MQIYNYMEDIVKNILEELLSHWDNICSCEKCRLDITAWVLNRLPSKYIVTDKGRMYTKLKEQEIQFRTDIIRELTKAISYVSKNPQH